jgi:3-hydroxyisobutyrate dehydrogenase-like beta-hydroxyacid dehydrogenase
VAADPAQALVASAITVVCLLDDHAVDAVLDEIGDRVTGSVVVNLTSSTPEAARRLARRVRRSGGRYLDGTIMVPTPLIGTADALVLYSGDGSVHAEHLEVLRSLGRDAVLLGDDPGLAAAYDLAMLDIFFNGMAAFLHAAALVAADGVAATTFLPYAERMVSVLATTMVELADEVDRGEHPGDADTLTMERRALDHVVEASAARGLDPRVPMMPRDLIDVAIARGHGEDGFSRVIDVLRDPGPGRPVPRVRTRIDP